MFLDRQIKQSQPFKPPQRAVSFVYKDLKS